MKKIIFLIAGILLPLALTAQVNVTGNVKEAKSGEPIIGATVMIQGTSTGTVTDFDGNFSLTAPDSKATLVFSYLGFKTLQMQLGGKTSVIVQMEENAQSLDEVVIVGYGVQKKETLVGSISSIKSQDIVSVPASNLTQTLAGKAAGLTVVQPSGEIGRDEAEFYIRGIATFYAENQKPLILVDGIIRESFAQIDPNEVESINILKDASATAVFGVKGANGVVIVTTKRGHSGKAEVSFTSQFAANYPMRLHTPIEGYRTAVLKNTLSDHQGVKIPYSASQLMNWRTKVSPYTEPDVDWMDEIMKSHSWQQQYNVNIRGGSDAIQYFISTGFFDQDSPFRGDDITDFNRYNFRSNLDFQLTKDLKLSFNMGARIENRQYPTSMYWSTWDIYRSAFSQSGILYPVYNMDGSYSPNNIFARIYDSGTTKDKKTVMETALNVEYKLNWLLDGLGIRGQVSYDDNSNQTRMYHENPATYKYMYGTDTYTLETASRPLRYDWDDVHNSRKAYWEGAITYDKTFNKIHSVNAMLLFNQLLSGTDAYPFYATQGLVGRLVYNYEQKYLAEVNFGYNGSENFSPQKRYGIFPSFALGWIASREKFWENAGLDKIITHFKLRGSLGWVGNDRAWYFDTETLQMEEARFIYLQNYLYQGGYMFGDNIVGGVHLDKIKNPNIGWEKARKIDAGFDAQFMNGLFGLTVDYFHEHRKDILLDINPRTPAYIGARLMPANVGEMKNYGVDIELTHFNKINKDFSYNVKGTFGFARNEVIKYNDAEGALPYQKSEGFAMYTPLKYITLGYFQSYEEIENSPSQLGIEGNTEVNPGDLKYKDINGDGVIDRFDMVHTGYPTIPEIQYGISLGFTWKNFDVTCLFQGSANASFDKNWETMWAFSNNDNVFPRHWYYWNPETGDARADYTELYGKYYNNEAGADYTLSNANYIRLKNMDVGYTLPKEWVRHVFISNARIYISGLNLITWSKEKTLDPDNRNSRGAYMPPVRTVNFGLNINF